ncbi:alpha/beta hydrolase [Streptomyces sp. NPDC020965]|uniref:alpha/beta hydrolase n=1 Tax=Streptomyces sp. NPDC020965 TaxID=3365105 RepID=UPI003790AAE1
MATLAPGLAVAAPSSTTGKAPAPAANPLDRFTQQKLVWKRCAPDAPAALRCATVKVPLDYTRPSGKTLNMAISRIKATNPAKRHGVMLLNPGGPGGSGLWMPLYWPKEVAARYDMIGFDPRGVGASSPVNCGLTPKQQEWPRPYQSKTFAKDVAWAKTVAEKCRKKEGDTLRHITTRNTARDMDVVRAVLGEKKLNYLGYSYGTYLGAVYAQMFPKRTDRFVLDSAVDPKLAWRGMIQVWAEGAEPAFDRWAKWTAARSSTYKLGSTSAKVEKTFWDLVAAADRKPIKIEGESLSGTDIRGGMRGSFFSPKEAAELVVMLKKAAAGKPARLGTLTQPPRFAPDAEDNMTSSFWSVVCGDNSAAWPKSTDQYRKDALRDKKRYPLFGDFASNIKPCAFWDKSVEPATVVNNSVKMLIVQNEWDAQTPLSSALGMHRALKGSKLLTVKGGEGHGVYASNVSKCADAATTAYLTTGKLPAKNLTCTPSRARTGAESSTPKPAPVRLPNRW